MSLLCNKQQKQPLLGAYIYLLVKKRSRTFDIAEEQKFALTREVKNSERLPSWENNWDCDRFKCRLKRTNEIRGLERC